MFTHHAYLFLGTDLEALPIDEKYKKPSEDVTLVCVPQFGIDDARACTAQAAQRPLTLDKKVCIICAESMTSEAQNALLKLFEEPPASALFYLMVPKQGLLLPTLLSRLSILTEGLKETQIKNEVYEEFKSLGYGDRITQVAVLTKEKDVARWEAIIAGAEQEAHETQDRSLLHTLSLVRSYIGARGASNKMLLEALALALPAK